MDALHSPLNTETTESQTKGHTQMLGYGLIKASIQTLLSAFYEEFREENQFSEL